MLKIKIIVILIVLLFCSISIAEVKPMPSPKQEGDLGLIVVASDSPKFINEWIKTPPEHAPTIKRLFIAKPEQLIVSAFLVTGMSSDESGKFAFSVSYYLLGPDGKPLFGTRDYAKGTGKLPQNPVFIMADPALDIVLEQSDPPGICTIVGQVTDLINGKKADSFYKIRFIKEPL